MPPPIVEQGELLIQKDWRCADFNDWPISTDRTGRQHGQACTCEQLLEREAPIRIDSLHKVALVGRIAGWIWFVENIFGNVQRLRLRDGLV